MTLYIGSLQLGLLYGILALGIYITFRILNLPDLTVDGSFTLGMAVTAILTLQGFVYLSIIIAVFAGAMSGLITGLLQTKLKIHPILAGILVMTGLYSVNIFIMDGKSNVAFVGKPTIFTKIQQLFHSSTENSKILTAFLFCMIVFMVLVLFFKTRTGMAIRATGDNEDMVRSSSINADDMKCLGLAIGNGLVALSGSFVCQSQLFSDVGFGSGLVVIGLASVIIGETFLGKHSVTIGFLSAIIGSIIYRFILALALQNNFLPAYSLKLISSLIVAVALSIPTVKAKLHFDRLRKEES